MFYALCSMPNCLKEELYSGSYACISYPLANLCSQRLSDILSFTKTKYSQREILSSQFKEVLEKREEGENILIDSIGLTNRIQSPIASISKHNGEISNKVRIICMYSRRIKSYVILLGIYDNIIDVSTLTQTTTQTPSSYTRAGYLIEQNSAELYSSKASFIRCMPEKLLRYSSIIDACLPKLESDGNHFIYNDRYIYIIWKQILSSKGNVRTESLEMMRL